MVADWKRDLSSTPLQIRGTREINREVLRGLDQNSERSTRLIVRHLPGFLHSLGRDFAGIKGSRVYNAVQNGGLVYQSWHFEKTV